MKPQRWSNKHRHRRHSSQQGGPNGSRPVPPWISRGRPPMRSPSNFNESSPAEQHFLSLVSVDPFPRIQLESGLTEWTTRAIDLLAPVGRGQRGLIVSPPKSGKTTILKHMCQAITKAEPTMKVYCLLIDERPEEVPDFRRNVTAEVHWSTSDQPYENHIRVAKELMAKAIGEADQGKDELGRAHV